MKYTLVIALILSIYSCRKVKETIDNLLSFDIVRDIPAQSIQGSLVPCQAVRILDIDLFDLDNIVITQEQDFPEQNTEVRLIREAYLKTFVLSMTAESSETNWDWLDEIQFSISADGQSEVVVAELVPTPEGESGLSLSLLPINIAPYLKADGGFTFKTSAKGCPPASDAEFVGQLVISVSASPL